MCGITAIVDANAGDLRAGVDTMAATLRHRGPDDAGSWEGAAAGVALGHRRLSIVDLSPLGHNPMTWQNGRYWITYNGEVYNFRALRAELETHGCRFASQTDTEVILAAYDQWGLDCLGRFIGMFAFALWDRDRETLVIARDRLGKKPLYYSQYGGRIAIASELKAIASDPRFPRDIDRHALGLYLRFGYVPAPFSIFTHARKLPPGHAALVKDGVVEVRRYWDPVPFACERRNPDPAVAERQLDALLADAVRLRMLADVPVGAFLSGGIDSSLVVALMKEQSHAPVRTFTVRFDDPAFNEADHAAAVARHLGTEHHERTCDDRQLLAVVDGLADMFDEPFADSSAIPTYIVSKAAREHVTVALSGDGGDELFFGYPRYKFHADSAWVLGLPKPVRRTAALGAAMLPTRRLRRIADVLRDDDPDRYARFVTWWSAADVETMTGSPPGAVPLYADALARSSGISLESRAGLLDLVSYLPEDILTKVDRASMAVSLEVRAPLLDHRVVELALGLPMGLKRRHGATKWILRQLLYKRVPRLLVDRPKMGFGVPLDRWLRGPLRDRMDDYCGGADLEDLGIDPQPVRLLWREFLDGRSHRTDLLWLIFALVAWSRRFRAAG
jgi:asparagine synthase (glutamine-hydrolysing)